MLKSLVIYEVNELFFIVWYNSLCLACLFVHCGSHKMEM